MKKGCFLTVIVVLTVILIGVFYLVRFHGEDLIELGKDRLVEFAQNQIESDIEKLDDNEYVDSLKIVIGKYFEDIDKLDVEKELERIEEFSDDFEVILMDSKIDSAEFDFITNILVKYEQRKEN
jgi:hypothetical protein